MIFSVKSTSPEEWKAVVNAVKISGEEATFNVAPEGMNFRGISPDKVALVELTWPASAFAEFKCEKPTRFNVRTDDLAKIIGRAKKDDTVEVSQEEENGEVKVVFAGDMHKEFLMHLIEIVKSSAPTPHVDYEAELVATKDSLTDALGDIAVVSPEIALTGIPEAVVFNGKSDAGKGQVILGRSSSNIKKYTIPETVTKESPVYAKFGIEYLQAFFKAVQGPEFVSVKWASKKPIQLDFDLNDKGAKVTFWLAPRVGED